jgi:hypothetical protein
VSDFAGTRLSVALLVQKTIMLEQGSYGPWNSWNILEKKADPE